ncbi:MAG: hypothetical protein GC154_20160 [bacterium]|nr:hypothetical protein [bacterium]
MKTARHFILALGLSIAPAFFAYSAEPQPMKPDDAVSAFLQGIKEPVRVATQAAQAYWSPDGNSICFTRKPDNQDVPGGVFTLRLDGESAPVRVTESGKDPVWSPDGQWIAYVDEAKNGVPQSIWVTDAAGEKQPEFIGSGGYPNWFPDSESLLVYSPEDSGLLKVNIKTKQREKVTDFPYPYPCLSPDGKRVAFPVSGRGVITSNLDGSQAILNSSTPVSSFLGRWSPDGKRLAFGGFPGAGMKLYVLDATTTGEPAAITEESWTRPAWSPDGLYIVCDSGAPGYEVWITPVSAAHAKTEVDENVFGVTLDVSQAPELEDWGNEAKQLIEDWYGRICNLIPTKDFSVPKRIRLRFRSEGGGVAETGGTRISVFSGWVKQHPDDIGLVFHELVHVVQHYTHRAPGWLTEGIADYLRWAIFEGKPQDWFPYSDKPDGYRDSYRVTGGFFLWLETDRAPGIVKKLNTALRLGNYPGEEFFERETGMSVRDLWAEYLKERKTAS